MGDCVTSNTLEKVFERTFRFVAVEPTVFPGGYLGWQSKKKELINVEGDEIFVEIEAIAI